MFPVLPGSTEVQVTRGGIVKRLLIAYFISNSFPKISKSVHMCQSYSKQKVGRFEVYKEVPFGDRDVTAAHLWDETS